VEQWSNHGGFVGGSTWNVFSDRNRWQWLHSDRIGCGDEPGTNGTGITDGDLWSQWCVPQLNGQCIYGEPDLGSSFLCVDTSNWRNGILYHQHDYLIV
jgi:hypothetical protein